MGTDRKRKALDIPELERLEPIHTKGLQRVFGALGGGRMDVPVGVPGQGVRPGILDGRVLNDAGADREDRLLRTDA